MLPQQGYLERARGRVSLWGVAACFTLLLGYELGQPRAQPYLIEILLLALAVGFVVIMAVSIYVYISRTKPAEMPNTMLSLGAIAVFLLVLFLVAKWSATAELRSGAMTSATSSASPGR